MFSKPLALPFDPGSSDARCARLRRPSYVEELWSPVLTLGRKKRLVNLAQQLSSSFSHGKRDGPFSLGRGLNPI
jgi:hypothetical protein